MDPYSNNPGNGGPVSAGASPAWGAPAAAPGAQGIPAWGGSGSGVAMPSGGGAPSMASQGPKWPALRTIATVLKIVAWIEAGVGVLSALGGGIALGATIGGSAFFLVLFMLVSVAIAFLWTYASSELIMLLVTLEKNTRKYE